jgi:hypothetical protein
VGGDVYLAEVDADLLEAPVAAAEAVFSDE